MFSVDSSFLSSVAMKNLVVFLVALLLIQAALAKKDKKSSKVFTCPQCPTPQLIVAKEAIVCQNEGRQIRCPAGSTIRVLESFYGRKNPYACPVGNVDNVNCDAKNALAIAKSRCDRTEVCNVTSANTWLADPCVDTSKYLEITWICEPRSRRQ